METILYTDNRSLALDYTADTIILVDNNSIDTIIASKVYKTDEQDVHFWIGNTNSRNISAFGDKKFINELCKVLLDKSTGCTQAAIDFEVQFQKYIFFQQSNTPYAEAVTDLPQSLNKNSEERLSNAYRLSKLAKLKAKTNRFDRQRTGFCVNNPNKFLNQVVTTSHYRILGVNDIPTVKSLPTISDQPNTIKSYRFRTARQEIEINYFQESEKSMLDSIIRNQVNQKGSKAVHIVLLFLFFSLEGEDGYTHDLKNKNVSSRCFFKNFQEIEILEKWKITQWDKKVKERFEKELRNMRTQVISEKISFRKKIAAIEEAIGDTINVERLAQEDVDNALIMNKAPPDSAQKAQKMASLVTIIEKPKLPVGLGSLTGHTSQFKRLKEISQVLKSVEITLKSQQSAIDNHLKRLKQTIKTKNQLVSQFAKQANAIRRDIEDLQQQKKEYELQKYIKQKEGLDSPFCQLKNEGPSQDALCRFEAYKEQKQVCQTSNASIPTVNNSAEKYKIMCNNLSVHSINELRKKRLANCKQSLLSGCDSSCHSDEDQVSQRPKNEDSVKKDNIFDTDLKSYEQQLKQLYQVYLSNSHILNKIQIKLHPRRDCVTANTTMKRSTKKVASTFNQNTGTDNCLGNLDFKEFPILEELLQGNENTQPMRKKLEQTRDQPAKYPNNSAYSTRNDFFEAMFYGTNISNVPKYKQNAIRLNFSTIQTKNQPTLLRTRPINNKIERNIQPEFQTL